MPAGPSDGTSGSSRSSHTRFAASGDMEQAGSGLRKLPDGVSGFRSARGFSSGRSLSAPRQAHVLLGHMASVEQERPPQLSGSPQRPASSLDCPSEQTARLHSSKSAGAPVTASSAATNQSGTGPRLCTTTSQAQSFAPLQSASTGPIHVSQSQHGIAWSPPPASVRTPRTSTKSLDGGLPGAAGSPSRSRCATFAETIESMLSAQSHPNIPLATPRACSPSLMNASWSNGGTSSPRVGSPHSKSLSSRPIIPCPPGKPNKTTSPFFPSPRRLSVMSPTMAAEKAAASTAAAEERERLAMRMVLYTEPLEVPGEEPVDTGEVGLGSIQGHGRAEILNQWLRSEQALAAGTSSGSNSEPVRPSRSPFFLGAGGPSSSGVSSFGVSSLGISSCSPGGLFGLTVPPLKSSLHVSLCGAQAHDGTFDTEWSTFSDASRQAIRQWVQGQLGGRHCMLVLEHGTDAAASVGQEEPSMADLRDGLALHALSGLHSEVGIMGVTGGQDVSWLFENVFDKQPHQVLMEAIEAIRTDVADPRCTQPSDLTAEQANLALRRRAMIVQFESGAQLLEGGLTLGGVKAADEFTRVQVWLELVRLLVEGVTEGTSQLGKEKTQSKGIPVERYWGDWNVSRELGKDELELAAESNQLSLDTLREQNRGIENYVMHLVRRRDDLKAITKLVEERDSYFILGLEGPGVTEDEVKRAYRKLARKEHPDKAGLSNKRRFQAIQQAYTNILKQTNEGFCSHAPCTPTAARTPKARRVFASSVYEAAEFARQAREAAERVVGCAHKSLRGSEESVKAAGLPKQRALRALRELTRQAVAELQGASAHLQRLGESISSLSTCVEAVFAEYREQASKTVAGIGLRDSAAIVEDAGRSALASSTMLQKITEATEATLKKIDKTSPDGEGSATRGRSGADDTGNLCHLGVRLLSESSARTAAVVRRCAHEALGSAMKAFELQRGLIALDIEARKERDKQNTKKNSFDEDIPVPAGDVERKEAKADDVGDCKDEAKAMHTSRLPEMSAQASPRDQLKFAAKRVKDRHVALRVKNLRFLASLNEEALRMQGRLYSLLARSSGALLPEIAVLQKRQMFDLIAQLLEFALAECSRMMAHQTVSAQRTMERALGFALALEHSSTIAVPSDTRTQALKLAALIDAHLLCQIFSGPFKRRLLACGARRPVPQTSASGFLRGHGRSRTGLRTQAAHAGESTVGGLGPQTWEQAAHDCCARICVALRRVVQDAQVKFSAAANVDGDEAPPTADAAT
eukprot:TRINITY_DN48213_c0_g1_i1.p1 TRINITY_DN48213_c0_g1~~TRINITY_DN48213_c0_g1_i1.p1  ORF type:complete len:1379 (+),score=178.30 TRINITY_DN48213_c0_g1_i1:357-4139(+)